MPETTSCHCRSATVSILAALAMAVYLLALVSGVGMRQAYADDTENIAFSVPAKVPFAVKSDGTVIGPSASAWRIENEGTRPLRMKDVTASGFNDGLTVSAVSEAMPVAGTSTRGIWSINVSGGGVSLTTSVDGTIEIPVEGSAGFSWSANPSDSTKHVVGPVPMAIGMVSLTLGGADRVAFAVYSADDDSLNFYKRMDVPDVGDTLEGKTVTAVYTGFETTSYHLLGYDPATNNWDSCDTNTSWFDVRNNVTSINVVDQGIKPYNLAFFFRRFENLKSVDLVNFDLSETVSINSMFTLCKSLETVKIPGISRQCTEFKDAFACCPALTDLEFGDSDFSGGKSFYHMFNCDSSLLYDCTDWNVPPDAEHHGFNSVAPGVILPKPWQPTAFAIFSTDDGSLDFYKREYKDLPKAGDTFESKTVTEIYTSFETQRFVDTSSNHSDWTSQQPDTPWWGRRLEISSANVVDTGIRPSSVDYWFYGMENLKAIAVANLDTSSCDDFKMTFGHCGQIETIDLSAWSTASLCNLNGTFLCCLSLSTLDIDGWDTSKVVSFHCLMFDCKKMNSIKMQKVVDNLSVTECANDFRYLFNGCEKLTTINLSSWNISNVTDYMFMFFACHNLTLDCSHWNVQQDAWHGSFNSYAPGVILPKVWQPIAFAVFSADDKSLDFYKREYKDMPKIGDTFNNKTVSEVYSDIENYDFKISYETSPTGVGNAPWWNHRADIFSVKVVDVIKPKNMCGWFFYFANVTSIDLGPIDTSEVTSLFGTFDRCFSLKTLNVSMMNTSKVTSMDCAFFCDGELTKLDLSGWDFSKVVNISRMFYDCKKLGTISMPSSPNFVSHITSFIYMFNGCTNLVFDCSNWDVQISADHTKFNYGAPGVILPKKWQ